MVASTVMTTIFQQSQPHLPQFSESPLRTVKRCIRISYPPNHQKLTVAKTSLSWRLQYVYVIASHKSNYILNIFLEFYFSMWLFLHYAVMLI